MLRTTTKEALTQRQKRIFDFIDANHAGVLASVDPNGEPHAAVIYHKINRKDFSVSFLTKKDTKKYDNITRKNDVVLVVFDAGTQTVAQVFGKAKEIKDLRTINEIADFVNEIHVRAKVGSDMPIIKLEAGDYAAFRIDPAQIRLARYGSSSSGDHSHMFDSIESFELRPGV